jgi:hypothetical protein
VERHRIDRVIEAGRAIEESGLRSAQRPQVACDARNAARTAETARLEEEAIRQAAEDVARKAAAQAEKAAQEVTLEAERKAARDARYAARVSPWCGMAPFTCAHSQWFAIIATTVDVRAGSRAALRAPAAPNAVGTEECPRRGSYKRMNLPAADNP